jgi:hypothetical protein
MLYHVYLTVSFLSPHDTAVIEVFENGRNELIASLPAVGGCELAKQSPLFLLNYSSILTGTATAAAPDESELRSILSILKTIRNPILLLSFASTLPSSRSRMILTDLSRGDEPFLEAFAFVARSYLRRSTPADLAPLMEILTSLLNKPFSHCRALDCVSRTDLTPAHVPAGRAVNYFCDLAVVFRQVADYYRSTHVQAIRG